MSANRTLPMLFVVPALTAFSLLTGCASLQTAVPTPISGAALSGRVFGGQPPISGSHVYLYASGNSGYGSPSTSLLSATQPGVTNDSNGNGYATTDANGTFSISGDYICPSANAQVYLLAVGGNPGLTAGTSNNAITLMAGLGNCGNLTTSTRVNINEVTTAASVTALQQFMADTTHIGSSSTNTAGLATAFAEIPNLVSISDGSARTATLLGNGSVPQAKLNTLGNILAPCVNSASNASPACTSLFSAATPNGSAAPTEVAGAMLFIALNPGSHVSSLYNQSSAFAAFQPQLAAAPNDFSVGITYTGGNLTAPGFIAIDSSGNAWVANCPSCQPSVGTDSIVGFNSGGAVLSGSLGYTAGIHKPQGLAFDLLGNLWSTNSAAGSKPDEVVKQTSGGLAFAFNDSTIGGLQGLAIDSSNNAWVTNRSLNNIVKINSGGTRTQAPVTSPGFTGPTGINIDGSGIIFAAGNTSNSILKFNTSGTVLTPPGGYTGSGLSQPIGISIDAADHIWTVDNLGSAISELNGSDGSTVSGSPGYFNGLSNASILAIDGLGTVWYANCRAACGDGSGKADNVVHISSNGVAINPSDGLQDSNFSKVGTAAIDPSGNLWVTNNTGGSVTKLIGVAAPVRTPLAAAAAPSLGTRP
jgi:hypothetical protein